MSEEKLWSGRFQQATDYSVDQFNASISFDKRLARVDIIGSMAYAHMLQKCDIISDHECEKIQHGLASLLEKFKKNQLSFSIGDEDIHMNIERLLFETIGGTAGKLHTGRSRNDQVATDMHLYLREALLSLLNNINAFNTALIEQAIAHIETVMPGYTHLQRAQPVSLAQHLLAYVNMLQRDAQRLIDSWPRINTLPLGCGALAGSSFPLDREYLANLLGFEHIYLNSMDAVSDRDFVVEFISTISLIMMHLSRLSEELILWSSHEFSFIELSDTHSTGSSMLPHKKNPDIPELVRGKTGRVYGALMGILTTLKALPLSYNKDMQEDKEGLFDAIDTVENCLQIYQELIQKTSFNKNTMLKAVSEDYTDAIAVADYLCKRNIPFRTAHRITGEIVRHCIDNNIFLKQLPLQTYQQFHQAFDNTLYTALQIDTIIQNSNCLGGTSKKAIEQQLEHIQNRQADLSLWLDKKHLLILETQENMFQ